MISLSSLGKRDSSSLRLLTNGTTCVIEYSIMEEFSNKLKHCRVSKGWSQEQLARGLGVSLNTVQRWESGKTRPSPLAMEKLQAWLNDTFDQNQIRLL